MKVLLFILSFTLLVMGFIVYKWIRHSIRQAKAIKTHYIMNRSTFEVHVYGCSRIGNIEPWNRFYFDSETELPIELKFYNCRKCGGVLV